VKSKWLIPINWVLLIASIVGAYVTRDLTNEPIIMFLSWFAITYTSFSCLIESYVKRDTEGS
jgi:hypothetical protein